MVTWLITFSLRISLQWAVCVENNSIQMAMGESCDELLLILTHLKIIGLVTCKFKTQAYPAVPDKK